MKYHPDRFGDPEKFKQMQAAYDKLMAHLPKDE
jgi:curved DNA-binding protein CbpA